MQNNLYTADDINQSLSPEQRLNLPPLRAREDDPGGEVATKLLSMMAASQMRGAHAFRLLGSYAEGKSIERISQAINLVSGLTTPSVASAATPVASPGDPWTWPHISRLLTLWEGTVKGHVDMQGLLPSPMGIEAALKSLIQGQDQAVQAMADLCYWQRRALDGVLSRTPGRNTAADSSARAEANDPVLALRRGPMLVHGPTGCGKTHLVSMAADLMGLPFVTVDASTLVGEGIVGTSIGDVIKGLAKKESDGDRSARFSVLFIDEVDKCLGSTKFGGGIQAELLRLLEGHPFALYSHTRENWQVPSGVHFATNQLLIVLGGAFQELEDRTAQQSIGFSSASPMLRPGVDELTSLGGMGREFLGRMRQVVRMNQLDQAALLRILRNPHASSLTKYNARLRKLFGCEITLTNEACDALVNYAVQLNLGARPLENVIARLFAKTEREIIRQNGSHPKEVSLDSDDVVAVVG